MSSLSTMDLPPDIARQFAISDYVLIGSTSVLIWDILCHLSDDYKLVSRYRFAFPLAVYLVSRITNLVLLIGWCATGTALVNNCHGVQLVFNAFYAIAVPCSQLLFFLPVRAIWIDSPRIVWFFTLLWLATAASALSPLIGLSITDNCATGSSSAYTAIAAIVPCVNDTLLFFALVWRTLRTAFEGKSVKRWMWISIPDGASMPQIARALLLNGRAYYLCTVGITLTSIVMSYITTLPVAYRTILAYPAIALMNIMASRIYRNTKLGRFHVEASTTYAPGEAPSQLVFASSGGHSAAIPTVNRVMDSTSNLEMNLHGLSLGSPISMKKIDPESPCSP